jgi:uncharacterized protein RhaS with RHS repeats
MPELALYYYKARMYSPMLGRFMQADPIGYTDDINLYTYVANSPLSSTDPDGKTEVTITVQRTQETTHSTMGTMSATNGTTTVSGYSLEPPKNADPSGNGTTSMKAGTYGAFVRTAASSNDHN